MTKEKYALIVVATGVILVIAAALLMIFSGPKQTPWELTNTLLPGEVKAACIWVASSSIKLTQEQITEAVHYMNRLDKSDFRENSSHAGSTPLYGLQLECSGMDITINQVGGTKTEMNFDETTAKSLETDQWIIDDTDLADFILNVSGYSEDVSN